MQREVGPGALLRLIWGALRLDPAVFGRAASAEGLTRIYLAIVLFAAISWGFATATMAVAAGVLDEHELGFYRAVVISWAVAIVVHFLLFVGIAWLLRTVVRAAIPIQVLTRLLALSLAPYCLGILLAWTGYEPTEFVMESIAKAVGPSVFFLIGSLIGYFPDDLTILLGTWGLAIAIWALRRGGVASWPGAVATVLVAARLVGPLPEIADLVMNGVR